MKMAKPWPVLASALNRQLDQGRCMIGFLLCWVEGVFLVVVDHRVDLWHTLNGLDFHINDVCQLIPWLLESGI